MATMKKPVKKYAVGTVTTETTKKPNVVPKPKTASQRIGDLTLRDVKNATETALDLSTLGGYGAAKKGIKKLTGMKSGGTMKKAKCGTSMKKAQTGTSLGMKSVKAGVDKNPGITRADIITAATKKAKSGAKMAKCKTGCK